MKYISVDALHAWSRSIPPDVLTQLVACAVDAVPVAELTPLHERWDFLRLAMHEAGHQDAADAYRECGSDLRYACSDPPPATLRTGEEP